MTSALLPQQQLRWRADNTPDQLYLCQPIDRQWHHWTWGECYDESLRMAAALRRLGLKPGDRVGILSKNCAHWIMADYAIILAGLVSVPIYPTANAETIAHVLNDSGARYCFVGKLESPETQEEGIPDQVRTIQMPYPAFACDEQWEQLITTNPKDFVPAENSADDLITLLYTSGTTGYSKGAQHSHANFRFVGTRLGELLCEKPLERALSYLPLSHCTERAYVEAASLYTNVCLYFSESVATFMDDLRHARPTLFGSVPRLWKVFQIGILEKIPAQRLDRLLRIPVVKWLIQRKLVKGMGLDDCRWFASGAAPIAPALMEWWQRVGITITEGWGMTETFAYGTQLPPYGKPRFGSIGKVLAEADMKATDDGELLIRCPSLMSGYWGEGQLNPDHWQDGYFRTGDRGHIDKDGYVWITGRVKEAFKTAKGKYIAPVPIESQLAHDPLIEQACVVGSLRKQPLALIYINAASRPAAAELRQHLQQTLAQVNQKLEPHERLDRLIVVADAWTVENGLLTPTLKMKREVIEKRYADLIDAEGDAITFESGSAA
ncbi:MAG: AMP-binding protein [Wenzhouxiangellaceae bacterium]